MNTADRRLFEEVAHEAANLLSWEKFETPEERRENGRTARGRTVNALYYAIKALHSASPFCEKCGLPHGTHTELCMEGEHEGCNYLTKPGTVCLKCGQYVKTNEEKANDQ